VPFSQLLNEDSKPIDLTRFTSRLVVDGRVVSRAESVRPRKTYLKWRDMLATNGPAGHVSAGEPTIGENASVPA
jgi:hypothetical protein